MSDPAPENLEQPGGRTALLVIDMQNSYFELPGLAELKDEALARVNELLRTAHEAGRPVILTRTQHQRDGSTWTLNMRDDGEGFAFPGTEQAAYLPGLDTGDHLDVVKTRDNAFHDTDLREQLDRLGVTHLLICGVSTHSCVAQTAMAAFAENLHAAVARDAVVSQDPDLSDALLEFLNQEMRQPILSQAESLTLLREGWPPR